MTKIQIKKALQLATVTIATKHPQDFEKVFGLEGLEELLLNTTDMEKLRIEDVLKEALSKFDEVIQFQPGDQVIIKKTREVKTIEAYMEGVVPPITLINDNNIYFPEELTFG